MVLFRLLWVVLLSALLHLSTGNWIKQPNPNQVAVAGDGIQLTWQYPDKESHSGLEGRLNLKQNVNGNTYDAVVLEARLNASTGNASIVTTNGRARLITDRQTVKVTFPGVTRADSGTYKLAIKFNGDLYNDEIHIIVFEMARLVERPSEELKRGIGSRLTLRYIYRQEDTDIPLTGLTLTADRTGAPHILYTATIYPDSDHWQSSQPDSVAGDRLSVRRNVSGVVADIRLTLWDLATTDAGVYSMTAIFGNHTRQIQTDTQLHVGVPEFTWVETPGDVLHTIQNGSISAQYSFTRSSSNTSAIRYEFYKLSSHTDLVFTGFVNGREISEIGVNYTGRLVHLATSNTVHLSLTPVRDSDSGLYTLRVITLDLLVLTHTVTVRVHSDAAMEPVIMLGESRVQAGSSFQPGLYEIRVPNNLPAANLSVYTGIPGYANWTKLAGAVSARVMCVTLIDDLLSHSVTFRTSYGFYNHSVTLGGSSIPKTGTQTDSMMNINLDSQMFYYSKVNLGLMILVSCFFIFLCCIIVFHIRRQKNFFLQNGSQHTRYIYSPMKGSQHTANGDPVVNGSQHTANGDRVVNGSQHTANGDRVVNGSQKERERCYSC